MKVERLDEPSISDERSTSTDDNISFRSETQRKDGKERELRETLIKSEEKAVRAARIFVIITVIAMTVAVSVSVYFFASGGDQYSFEIAVSPVQMAQSLGFIREVTTPFSSRFALLVVVKVLWVR